MLQDDSYMCKTCRQGQKSYREDELENLKSTKVDIPISDPRQDEADEQKWRRDAERARDIRTGRNIKYKKQQRNAKCACGSGKKYKKCCLK
jgi:uncharacterized protein YecA (UPF0149 family)